MLVLIDYKKLQLLSVFRSNSKLSLVARTEEFSLTFRSAFTTIRDYTLGFATIKINAHTEVREYTDNRVHNHFKPLIQRPRR